MIAFKDKLIRKEDLLVKQKNKMKAILPHNFIRYATSFSRESMIYGVAYWAKNVFSNHRNGKPNFYQDIPYTIKLNGKPFSSKAMVAQTWLIDLIYEIACLENCGYEEINKYEALHLINLFSDYQNVQDGKRKEIRTDPLLNLYGFFGEQQKFQTEYRFFENFSREKYILDIISKKEHKCNHYGLDIPSKFLEISGLSTFDYVRYVLLIFSYFSTTKLISNKEQMQKDFSKDKVDTDIFCSLVEKYSIPIEKIKRSSLKRQVFYSKPIIKIGENYVAANPFLLLCMFENAEYWEIRNHYQRRGSTDFTTAFGTYFEMYFEEVLNNCLAKTQYQRLNDDNISLADWNIQLGEFDILIEQKSTLSLLGSKQSQPDIESLKNHMETVWGKAVTQLENTEKELQKNAPIKIILVYEDYYKCECLDMLFAYNKEYHNDNRYWLVTINELEILLNLYRVDKEKALEILAEKNELELSRSTQGRELMQIFDRHSITKNKYLTDFGIYQTQFEKVKTSFSKNEG